MPETTFPVFTPAETTRKNLDDNTIAIYLPDNLGHVTFENREDHTKQTTYEGGTNPFGEYDPDPHDSCKLDDPDAEACADEFKNKLQQLIDDPELFHDHFGRPF